MAELWIYRYTYSIFQLAISFLMFFKNLLPGSIFRIWIRNGACISMVGQTCRLYDIADSFSDLSQTSLSSIIYI